MEDVLSSLVDRVMVIMDTCLVVSILKDRTKKGKKEKLANVTKTVKVVTKQADQTCTLYKLLLKKNRLLTEEGLPL